jgi:SecD/SecF fusion protein
MNTKNLLLKLALFVVLPLVLSVGMLYTHNIKWGIDIRGGHSLTFEINTNQKDIERLKAQRDDLTKQSAQPDKAGEEKKILDDRIAKINEQVKILESAGDQPELLGKIINILKRRIDPNGLLALEWRPMGKSRFEVRMPAAKSQDSKYAYLQAMEKVEADNIKPSQISQLLAATGDARGQIIKTLSRGDGALADKLQALAEANDAMTQAPASKDGEAAATMPDAWAQKGNYEDKYDAVRKSNVSQVKLQAVLRLWVSETEKAALKNQDETARRMNAFDKGCKQLVSEHPSRKAELENVVKLYQAWAGTRQQLDDPSDLKRLIAKAGVLEFRICPMQTSDNRAGSIEQDIVRQYANDLKEFGPDYARKKDKQYQWFAIRGDREDFNNTCVVAPYGGKFYMLLDNTRNDVMLHSSDAAGWSLRDSRPEPDQYGRPSVGFTFNQAGADKFQDLTSTHIGQPMAVLLDDEVYSAPNIQSTISDRGVITGSFTQAEVDELSSILNAGSLPARLNVVDTPTGKMAVTVSESSFGPSLGEENKNLALKAGLWSLIVIGAFMMVYYMWAGLIADFAMVMNLVLILGAMSFLNAVFTLPGIAGVILSIGMAVDANVLIYERLREEQDRGQSVRMALKNAYDRAFTAIFDSNITTLLTCLILGWVGTEEVRGFAITLGLGVLFNLFTAVTVTRWIFQLMLERGLVKKRFTMLRIIGVPKVDWMAKRYYFWTFSIITGIIGLAAFVYQGHNILGIEFSSGTQAIVRLKDDALLQDPARKVACLPNDNIVKDLIVQVADKHGWTKLEGDTARVEKLIDPNRVDTFLAGHFRTVDFPKVYADKKIDKQQWAQAHLNTAYFDLLDTNKDGSVSFDELKGLPQNSYQLATTESDGDNVRTAIREAFGSELVTMIRVNYALAKGGHDAKLNIDLAASGMTPISSKLLDSADKNFRSELENYQGGLIVVVKNVDPPISTEAITQRINSIQFQQGYTGQINPFTVIGLESQAGSDGYSSLAILSKSGEGISGISWNDFANGQAALITDALNREEAMEVVNFDPAIAGETAQLAIIAIALGWLAIIIYLWIRFGSAKWGFAAVLCLMHDVMIIIGLVSISGFIYNTTIGRLLDIGSFKIDLTMVAALLTIIGYSVNDTIVVFDRIRENRGKLNTLSSTVINSSINQTLSRTILTSSTVFTVVFIMYVWGGAGIHAFNYALLAGVLFGTYSSIAVAAPMLMGFKAALGKRVMDAQPVGK